MLVPVAVLEEGDARTIAEEVGRFLRRSGYELQLMDRDEAVYAMEGRKVDAVLLPTADLDTEDAIGVVRTLRDAGPQPLIVVHEKGCEKLALDLLDLGADDFVCRDVEADDPVALRELRTRLASALRRGPVVEPAGEVCVIGDVTIQDIPMRVTRAGRLVPLTRIQFKLLQRLCQSPNRLVPFDELLRTAWPAEQEGSVVYLRTYMARIRKALGWPARPNGGPCIRARRGHGYVLELPQEA